MLPPHQSLISASTLCLWSFLLGWSGPAWAADKIKLPETFVGGIFNQKTLSKEQLQAMLPHPAFKSYEQSAKDQLATTDDGLIKGSSLPLALQKQLPRYCRQIYRLPDFPPSSHSNLRVLSEKQRTQKNELIFEGKTVVVDQNPKGSLVIFSDQAKLERSLNGRFTRVQIPKSLELVEKASVTRAESLLYDIENNSFSVTKATNLNLKTGLRLSTDKLSMVPGGGAYTSGLTTATSCSGDNPTWFVYYTDFQSDVKKNRFWVKNLFLLVLGVPVFYIPVLGGVLEPKRTTGFLTPKVRLGHNLHFQQGYYLNLAPNYDMTLTASLGNQGDYLGELEMRYLAHSGLKIQLSAASGEIASNIKVPGSEDGNLNLGTWQVDYDKPIGEAVISFHSTGYKLDKTGKLSPYFRIQSLSKEPWETLDHRYSQTELQVKRGESFVMGVKDYSWSLLNEFSSKANEPLYHVRPEVYLTTHTALPGAVLTFDASYDAIRPNSPSAPFHSIDRSFVNVELSHHTHLANLNASFHLWGLVKKYKSQLRDRKNLTIGATPTLNQAHMEGFSANLSLPLWKSETLFLPKITYHYTQFKDQSAFPSIDTGLKPLSYWTLGSANRFTGKDRTSDADQWITSLQIKRTVFGSILDAGAKIVYYNKPLRVKLPKTDPLFFQDSLVRKSSGRPLAAYLGLQKDRHDFYIESGEMPSAYRYTRLFYNYHEVDQTLIQIDYSNIDYTSSLVHNDLGFQAIYRHRDNWFMFGRWQASIGRLDPLSYRMGLGYEDCCVQAGISLGGEAKNGQPSQGYGFKLGFSLILKGLVDIRTLSREFIEDFDGLSKGRF